MKHGDIDKNILTAKLWPKIQSKVQLFSAENGPTLNAVCDKTMTQETLEINRRSKVSIDF